MNEMCFSWTPRFHCNFTRPHAEQSHKLCCYSLVDTTYKYNTGRQDTYAIEPLERRQHRGHLHARQFNKPNHHRPPMAINPSSPQPSTIKQQITKHPLLPYTAPFSKANSITQQYLERIQLDKGVIGVRLFNALVETRLDRGSASAPSTPAGKRTFRGFNARLLCLTTT